MKTAPLFSHEAQKSSRSSALLVALLMLSLITIIAVALLSTMTWEMSSAKRNYENQKARALALLGMNTAVAQLRAALDAWDNPYQNFAVTPPSFFWSVSPGILSRWSYTSTTPVTNYPLFSLDPSGANDLVNLNAETSDGSSPIVGGAHPPNISVYWTPVLQYPASAASAANPIVGRYAFWVDDESAKINVNTADGTMKYQTNSLGLGTPSEVSLQALPQGGADLSASIATNIVYLARTAGLNSPREILRAAGTTPDLYTNNVFNLTTCSRSPDLNIFGQPKMALMPMLGDSADNINGTNMAMNAITLQPPKEIYPTPSQLPPYFYINPDGYNHWQPINTGTVSPQPTPWPLAFRDVFGVSNTENRDGLDYGDCYGDYTRTNTYWINGMMLANYLAGTNAANQAVAWPPFPGSSTAGFAGKYTPRQIDSIVVQILSLGAKEISPDFFYTSDSVGDLARDMGNRGRRIITSPFIDYGWLSHQWVSGLGRSPKVDAMELEFTTYGSIGSTKLGNYVPPRTTLDIWQEWWLPAEYLGGNNVIPMNQPYDGGMYVGWSGYENSLNCGDLSENIQGSPLPPAPLPKSDDVSPSYWGNQLLTNNQGMDLAGNFNNIDDPDQGLSSQYHSYRYNALGDGRYAGAGDYVTTQAQLSSPFVMTPLQNNNSMQDWAPGEMRCLRSIFGSIAPIFMQTTADGSTLAIGGGIQVRADMMSAVTSDPDPVPLEAIRGIGFNPDISDWSEIYNGELWSNPSSSPINSSTPAGQTVRDRFLQSVIPVNFTMSVPGNSPDGSLPGITQYVLATVADPLVNKFPGDWNVTYNASAPTVPSYWSSATTAAYSNSSEYACGFHSALADSESYWLPQADCAVSYLADLANQTLIPRSARFPNIGYLQYLRTGIIPDDESQPYPTQHGTPFRLLSYAPSTETLNQKTTLGTSQSYPDWALLDLLYVPSILAPFGGPYGYYDTNSPPVWQGYGNPGVLSSFSTGGGSTPGRINPNGEVIYTTNTTIPQPGVSRTLPMQAVLHGLMVNQTLVPNGIDATAANFNPNPGYTGGTAVDDATIAQAIYSYLANNGPLCMPAELCNIPAIAELRPAVNATRNDLIRQIIGNLTTQSNTFSVWVAGESITKSKANSNYGLYEPGDLVSASVRYHFIVERYLDPGADGVYGNAVNAGGDGIVGTYDDPVDPVNHPFEPRYLYRVVSTEDIR